MSLSIKWMVIRHCVCVAWPEIAQLKIIDPLKVGDFNSIPVVEFQTSTVSWDYGKYKALFHWDHLVSVGSKITLLRGDCSELLDPRL